MSFVPGEVQHNCGTVVDEDTRKLCGTWYALDTDDVPIYRWCPSIVPPTDGIVTGITAIETALAWVQPNMTLTEDDKVLGQDIAFGGFYYQWTEAAGATSALIGHWSDWIEDFGTHPDLPAAAFNQLRAVKILNDGTVITTADGSAPSGTFYGGGSTSDIPLRDIWIQFRAPYLHWQAAGIRDTLPDEVDYNGWDGITLDVNDAGTYLLSFISSLAGAAPGLVNGLALGTEGSRANIVFDPGVSAGFGQLGGYHGRGRAILTQAGDYVHTFTHPATSAMQAYFNNIPFPLEGNSMSQGASEDKVVLGHRARSPGDPMNQIFLWNTVTDEITFPADDAGINPALVKRAMDINDDHNILYTVQPTPGAGQRTLYFRLNSTGVTTNLSDMITVPALTNHVVVGGCLNNANHFLLSNNDGNTTFGKHVYLMKIQIT